MFPKLLQGVNNLKGVFVVGGVLCVGGLYESFYTVPPGHVGYQNLFGDIKDHQYQAGYVFMNPLSNMVKLDLRQKIIRTESLVRSNEGLSIDFDTDVVYHMKAEQAKDVFVHVGVDYTKILISPQVHACVKNIIAGYEAKDLYNEKIRLEIRQRLFDYLKTNIHQAIVIDDVLINNITLPKNLAATIEQKMQAQQEMEKMDFVLEKEKKESERKQIEAQGIKAFQDTVAKGISKELLEWKGITATSELAKSPNTKIVIIGNTKNGLPLIYSDNKS